MGRILESLSDHCTISTCISTKLLRNVATTKIQTEGLAPIRLKWNEAEAQIFKVKLLSAESKDSMDSLLLNPMNQAKDIDRAIDNINKILVEAASFKMKNKIMRGARNRKTKSKNTGKMWYDQDLKNTRSQLQKLGKALLADFNNTYLRGKFFSLKKFYKKLITKKKKHFQTRNHFKSRSLRKNKPKGILGSV